MLAASAVKPVLAILIPLAIAAEVAPTFLSVNEVNPVIAPVTPSTVLTVVITYQVTLALLGLPSKLPVTT